MVLNYKFKEPLGDKYKIIMEEIGSSFTGILQKIPKENPLYIKVSSMDATDKGNCIVRFYNRKMYSIKGLILAVYSKKIIT